MVLVLFITCGLRPYLVGDKLSALIKLSAKRYPTFGSVSRRVPHDDTWLAVLNRLFFETGFAACCLVKHRIGVRKIDLIIVTARRQRENRPLVAYQIADLLLRCATVNDRGIWR